MKYFKNGKIESHCETGILIFDTRPNRLQTKILIWAFRAGWRQKSAIILPLALYKPADKWNKHVCYNVPSIHNFSTSVSILAVMIPTESPISMKNPTARTAQQWRREKQPSLKNIPCSFERSFEAVRWPISQTSYGRSRQENSSMANIRHAKLYCEYNAIWQHFLA